MTFSFSRKPLLNSVRECQHKDGVRCCYTHSPTTVWPYLASGLRVSSGDVRGPEYWTVSGSASGICRCWCCLNPVWINTLFGFLHQMTQRTFKWLQLWSVVLDPDQPLLYLTHMQLKTLSNTCLSSTATRTDREKRYYLIPQYLHWFYI